MQFRGKSRVFPTRSFSRLRFFRESEIWHSSKTREYPHREFRVADEKKNKHFFIISFTSSFTIDNRRDVRLRVSF